MFTRFEENTNSNNTNSFTDYQSAPTTTPNPSQPDNNYTTRSCLEIINDGNNDSDTNSVDLTSLDDENDDANSPHLNHCSAKLYYNGHHHAHHFNHHDLLNSYCLENMSSPLSSGIDGSNGNNIDNNNMSTCLSSSPLSSYSTADQMKHDNNSYHRHIQQHDNDLSSQKSGKSTDRNVHCVKEKIRRDRIKYSCNELRRLIPNLNGLKTDMASLLETSVLWIQLITSNVPQEFLDDVQIKLEKMTATQNNYSSFSPQSTSSNVSISMPINASPPCSSSSLLNQTNFKASKRSRKTMSNLNKQMLNEEKMRLIKAQQQPPSLISSKMAMPAYSSSPLINNNVLVTTYHETSAIDYATSLESCSKQSKMMLNNQRLYSSTSDFPFKCQYLNPELIHQHQQQHNTNSFDYSSNYDLYNKLIKKGCQFIDNNINLSANAMHLKLNSKQLATDFDLPYSSQIQNFVQNN